MNKQNQWLFEASSVPATTLYSHSIDQDYYSSSEAREDCRNPTSDCPSPKTPALTVSGYSTHEVTVPGAEKRKIQAIANRIKNAASRTAPINICIVGHADKDPKGEGYERDTSRQRAEAVREAVRREINDETIWSKVTKQLRLFCAGASKPIVSFNQPLNQRARNRRVEIFVPWTFLCATPNQQLIVEAIFGDWLEFYDIALQGTTGKPNLTSSQAAELAGDIADQTILLLDMRAKTQKMEPDWLKHFKSALQTTSGGEYRNAREPVIKASEISNQATIISRTGKARLANLFCIK
jgi:hypothetical protein